MDPKIKESIAFFFAVALLAVVAGAENYNSEMGSKPWHARTAQQSVHVTEKFGCTLIKRDSLSATSVEIRAKEKF